MGFFQRFFSQMTQVSKLAKTESVTRRVPRDAVYVTVGAVTILNDAIKFNGGPAGWEAPEKLFGRENNRDYGYIPPKYGSQAIAYLVLTNDTLYVISDQSTLLTMPAQRIRAIDARSRSGFIMFFEDNNGIAVSSQTPVQIPPDYNFTTIKGMTNSMYGWDKALEKFGVRATF